LMLCGAFGIISAFLFGEKTPFVPSIILSCIFCYLFF
jgi:hypothetical protein